MIRKLAKLLLILFLAALLAGLGYGLWYLRSSRFREYVRGEIVLRLEKATGMECKLNRLTLDPFAGAFRLEGLTLEPKAARDGLLRIGVDEVSGHVGISSLWHLRLNLAELNIIRPKVEVISDGGAGGWNPGGVLESLHLSLDIAAGKVLISDGWLQLNNKRLPLDLSLDDLTCEIHYAAGPPRYEIRLAYRNSRVLYAERDIRYDFGGRFDLSMAGLDVDSFEFRRGKTILTGNGWMRRWEAPVLLLHAAGTVAGEDLYLVTSDFREARGNVDVAANFRLDAGGYHFLGKFDVKSGGFRRATLSSLRGSFEIRNDVLLLNDVDGKLGEGAIHAEGAIQLREANKDPHHVRVSAKGVLLRQVSRVLDLPELDYDNYADGSGELIWKRGDDDLDLSVQGILHPPSDSRPPSGRRLLLQGSLAATYRNSLWYFPSADLSSPFTRVQVEGLGNSTFHLRCETKRLSEPLGILRGFVPSLEDLLSRHPDLMDISGAFALDGEMRMDSSGTGYRGGLRIEEGRWRSYEVGSLASTVLWAGPHFELNEMMLRRGAESAQGDLILDLPTEGEQTPRAKFSGSIGRVSLSSLASLGVDVGSDASGLVSGSGWISNSGSVWEGDGRITIEEGSYRGKSFDRASGVFKAGGGDLQIIDCRVKRDAVEVTAQGRVSMQARKLNLNLRLAGLSLGNIPDVRDKGLNVQGWISASGDLYGEMDNPGFKGSFSLSGLRYASWDLGGGKGTLELSDNVLKVAGSIQSDLGKLAARASLSIEEGLPGKASVDFQDWNVQRLMSGNMPALLSAWSTALHGNVDVEGRFTQPADLNASGEVDGARFKIRDYELHNAGKMQFTVSKRALRLDNVNLAGDGTSLVIKGTLPLDKSNRLDLSLNGKLNLVFLEHFEEKVHISGTTVLNVRAMGNLEDPKVIGEAALQDARLQYEDLPAHLSSLQGNVVFSRNLVRLENVSGAVGSGTLRVSGVLEHENARLQGLNLQIAARGIRLPYPKDFRSLVDAELALRGNKETQVLSGDVNVQRSDYIREFNLLEQLAARSSESPGPLTTDPILLGLRLDVDIHSDRGLFLDNELTRLRGSFRLTLRGTPAYPYLTGRVEATEGTIYFRGNRFDILHASADFLDRNRINPVLDVRAEADVKTYRLVMDVNGDLDHLNINVTSDPPLSTVDIVSLLTTGKSLDPSTENTRQQSEMAGLSAASILSESLTGVIGKRVQRIFGLETFRVDPFLAGAENSPTARVTISERISNDMTVTFSRNLSTNEEQIVVVEYDVTRNLTIVASRDEQGKFGLDFRFRKRFR